MINTIREIKDLKISSGLLNSLNFKINTQPGENLPDYANNNLNGGSWGDIKECLGRLCSRRSSKIKVKKLATMTGMNKNEDGS